MARSALENCSHVNSLIYSVPIQSANLTQLFLSVATMISVFYGLYSANQTAKQARRIQAYRIQFSLWIIFLIALLLYFLLSLQVTVLKTYGFIQLMFNRNPCAFLWTKQTCILIKFPISASIIGFNLLAVIVLFERVIGTYFIKLYSRYGKFLGLTLTVLTLLINFVILYYMYKDQEIRGPPSYCITTLLTSQRKVSNVMSLFVFFNIATMFGVVLLFFTSRRQMDRRDVDYKLSKSLELNENYVSNQLVVPLTILHFFLFLVYASAFLWVKTIVQGLDSIQDVAIIEWIYTLNFGYALIMCNYGFHLRKKLLSKKPEWLQHRATNEATELYFLMFDELIDSNVRR